MTATAQNRTDRSWHPHHNMKGLARHLERLDDYLQIYAPLSGMTVHAADPETHLNIADDGSVTIKALATTEPRPVTTALHLVAGYLQKLLSRFLVEWDLHDTPFDRLLTAASMRFVGLGDGTIPADLQPEAWPTAIRVTQAPLAELVEEALRLISAVVKNTPDGLTETEVRDATGLDAMQLGDRSSELLRLLLGHLVDIGELGLDNAMSPNRFRVPGS